MRTVDWSSYARQYDLMSQINPAYQELVAHCVQSVLGWNLKPGDVLADLGAGTGNFSIALARALPNIQILHLDNNEQMLSIARSKAGAFGLSNWKAAVLNCEQEAWNLPALDGAVSVHCIYALKNPKGFIAKLCSQIKPGGYLYACDFGREMSVFDWGRYLMAESIKSNGVVATMRLIARCSQVRRQNKRVAACQRSGIFWTHDLEEFKTCFERAGIKISVASFKMYRGYDDLIIGRKPSSKSEA